MMPPQKKSKKNTTSDADQEDHHIQEENGNTLITDPQQIANQEREAKLEALKKARAKKNCKSLGNTC
jgi:hypothetical protein